MLVFQADQEQENTFNKLIQTMGEQVAWEGRFIVRDDELILEGAVRSLIFQFETKKVVTNLIDLPVREDQVADVSRHPRIKDLINMVLYAFGKWGTLRGLRVEQDYPQLNQLFGKLLSLYYIEPSFRKENFRFYKVGVRITYEEALQTVLEFEKKLEDDPGAESQGLWHRLIWKNRERSFQKTETTLLERTEDRIGNNFYLVGYLCPKCSGKLHMAVYPDGKEVRIDTEEKGVYLARAYTCSSCNCFYTPRPDRLISEGLIYEMNFGEDKKAYEDYLELLGYNGERAANFKYNEYEAIRKQRLQRERQGAVHADAGRRELPDFLYSPQDALRQMEEFSKRFASLPDDVFQRFVHRVEEGFYPDSAVAKHEKEILEQTKERKEKAANSADGTKTGTDPDGNKADAAGNAAARRTDAADAAKAGTAHTLNTAAGSKTADYDNGNKTAGHRAADGKAAEYRTADRGTADKTADHKTADHRIAVNETAGSKASDYRVSDYRVSDYGASDDEDTGHGNTAYGISDDENTDNKDKKAEKSARHYTAGGQDAGSGASRQTAADSRQNQADGAAGRSVSEQYEKYEKRAGMLHRLSDRQRQELKKQIQRDSALEEYEKKELTGRIAEAEFQEKADAVLKKAEGSVNKTYAQMQKVIRQVEREAYAEELKGPFLDRLRNLRRQRGEEEVRRIIENAPERLDRAGYQELEQKLKAYEDIDMSPYKETLGQKREAAEKQEIAGIVKRARKISRKDYVGLMRRLEEQKFADENVTPYMEKIKEKVQELDERRLNELLDQLPQMDYNAAAAVYEEIEGEDFLPELKGNALEMLSRRLEKIRTDECELLVQKLQEELQDTIKENPRHHFYPARKVMLKTAKPEETNIIDHALSAYAEGRSMFEYPIICVDTSRNYSGREGMILTPDHLYYSTRMRAYEIPISSIASIEASTGLLNRKITLEETNGAEHKLPYAVKISEMEGWAEILDDFVHYLQEKPASRKLAYLAKETHDTICCYRCGYVYHGRDVCPECGYKKNR